MVICIFDSNNTTSILGSRYYMKKAITGDKQKAERLIKQAQGLVNKVAAMIESGTYCPEIIQQTQAAIGLLRSAEHSLLRGHLYHCVEKKIHENKDQTVEELLRIYDLT